MIIYLSGPITGMPDYRLKFEDAARNMRAAGYSVLNPCDFDGGYDWPSWMRICIARMLEANGVAYLPGWQYSKGAQVEIALAQELGIPVYSVGEWCHPDKEYVDHVR